MAKALDNNNSKGIYRVNATARQFDNNVVVAV